MARFSLRCTYSSYGKLLSLISYADCSVETRLCWPRDMALP